ncbi:MAG: flavodoxin [Deltaproteobacteria bacterium]|nr:flavodoxin [Deltaproteobacteria bacterium]
MTIGIFYSTTSGATLAVAKQIGAQLEPLKVDIHDISAVSSAIMTNYEFIILGAPTMGLGELSDEWETWLETITEAHVANKKVALFGLGDQEGYDDSFVDALGIIYDHIVHLGAVVVGEWPTEGYNYEDSKAERDGQFVGLVIDDDTQAELTVERISRWVNELKQQL